jgi:hypothetical protein
MDISIAEMAPRLFGLKILDLWFKESKKRIEYFSLSLSLSRYNHSYCWDSISSCRHGCLIVYERSKSSTSHFMFGKGTKDRCHPLRMETAPFLSPSRRIEVRGMHAIECRFWKMQVCHGMCRLVGCGINCKTKWVNIYSCFPFSFFLFSLCVSLQMENDAVKH